MTRTEIVCIYFISCWCLCTCSLRRQASDDVMSLGLCCCETRRSPTEKQTEYHAPSESLPSSPSPTAGWRGGRNVHSRTTCGVRQGWRANNGLVDRCHWRDWGLAGDGQSVRDPPASSLPWIPASVCLNGRVLRLWRLYWGWRWLAVVKVGGGSQAHLSILIQQMFTNQFVVGRGVGASED